MRRPSVRSLPREWAQVSRSIGATLARAGRRGWIVGGTVRDLARAVEPVDVDMASDAPPEEVERLFPRTFAVGKAFGTIVVHLEGRDVQLTTFRTEVGYSDRRRPDAVAWGTSVEEDAARRDFTCNALYLDPLDDTLADPTGGLADIEQRVLRCVGDPAERFREDGLRLVRLARFAAALDFGVDAAALEAARREREALAGVSAERVAEELRRIFSGPRAARALRLLDDLGLLDQALPGLARLPGPREDRWRALEALEPLAGVEEGLCVLCDPAPGRAAPERAALELAGELLDGLRLSREERRAVGDLWRLQTGARQVLAQDHPSRATRVRLVRETLWPRASRLLRGWQTAMGETSAPLGELVAFGAALAEEQLRPPALVRSEDLAAAGIPRGPRWGSLLAQVEELQLELQLTTREEALAWLAREASP